MEATECPLWGWGIIAPLAEGAGEGGMCMGLVVIWWREGGGCWNC